MANNDKVKEEIKDFFDYKNLTDFKKLVTAMGLLVFLALVPVLLRGCIVKPPPMVVPPRPVEAKEAIQKDVPVYFDSFGTLAAPYDVDIKAQVTGKIFEVKFKEGQDVKTGDMLFVIDPNEYIAQVEKAKATLAEDLAKLKLKSDTLERNKSLFQKELISQQDFEQYATEVESASAQVDLDKANLSLAEINLGYCYIASPIDGVTGKRQVDPGNIVSANTGPTLVNVKYIDELYVDFTLPEKDVIALRKAMDKGQLQIQFTVEEDPESKYAGELLFLDNTVDEQTGTVFLRAKVNNTERKLWAGQFVLIKLILGTENDAILVPYEAVQLGRQGPYLFSITPKSTVDLVQVDPGQRQDDYIVIKKGVKAGEKVVTLGQLGLSPGTKVFIREPQKQQKKSGKKK